MRGLLFFVLLSISSISFAAYGSKGWHWYDINVDYSDDAPKVTQQVIEKPISYSQQLEAFHQYYNEVQAKATITNNVKDVAYAALLRKWIVENSIKNGQAMKEALLEYPQLSASVKNPTTDLARQLVFHQNQEKEDRAIRELSKSYGLFFFYKGKDIYANAMAKSVQEFADEYGIALIGYPVDGYAISDIKNNKAYHNEMTVLGVKALPALFLVNPRKRQALPLTYGFVAEDTIKQHYVDIATNFGKREI
ncbi:conjugal transfer protein TraF [Thiotrichales bacterium 19S3-7]|nr:conjugal transfer protein TraF [Thiotrichales bacterium 19S3-7]MCF6802251.1 conjugal transfer protein TraF [Thiotrichales bacterium 19S3-11]